MIKLIFLFVATATLSLTFQPPLADACAGFIITKYNIHVVNLLPKNSPPLTLHCASRDDDLGFHQLGVRGDFHWSFCRHFFGKTLFFCHIWWNGKEKAFDVYNQEEQNDKDFNLWAMKADGISSPTIVLSPRSGRFIHGDPNN